MKLEYYVLNYDHNENKVKSYNIFNNWTLYNCTLKEIEAFIKNPHEYKFADYDLALEKPVMYCGFSAFRRSILRIIRWEMWARVEYEISVSEPFPDKNSIHQKIDCYSQCEPNIDAICHEIIHQYKNQVKGRCENCLNAFIDKKGNLCCDHRYNAIVEANDYCALYED